MDGPTVPGIDVSAWQGDDIDWDAIAAGGDADFAFIRVMHGLKGDGFRDGPDAHFDRNWAETKRVGMLRGAYQYFITAEDPIAQADFLIAKVGPLEDGDLPPVIDVEVRDEDPIVPVPQIIENIGIWLDRVEGALGVPPIIYTSQSMWERMTENSEQFSHYPLWVANYTTKCPLTPDAWDRWAFHQYSSTGGIEGYEGDIDKNVFAGSIEELTAMAHHSGSVAPDAGAQAADAGGGSEVPEDDMGCGCNSSKGGAGSLLLFAIAGLALAYRRRRALCSR
jgi:lysozyme